MCIKHDMNDMKYNLNKNYVWYENWRMRNDMIRMMNDIWNDMKNDIICTERQRGCIKWQWKWKNVGISFICIMYAHALGDTPIPSWGYGLVHPLGRRSIIMFYIMLPWQLLILMGVSIRRATKADSPLQEKGPRCANCLVSSYLHVWAVCRVYGTHPSCPLE